MSVQSPGTCASTYPDMCKSACPRKSQEFELKPWILGLEVRTWGAWVAQSVEHPSLGFDSGHKLIVRGFKPNIGICAGSVEPAWDSFSLSLSLSAPTVCALSLSLSKINKRKKKSIALSQTQREILA